MLLTGGGPWGGNFESTDGGRRLGKPNVLCTANTHRLQRADGGGKRWMELAIERLEWASFGEASA